MTSNLDSKAESKLEEKKNPYVLLQATITRLTTNRVKEAG